MKIALDSKYKSLADSLEQMNYQIVPLHSRESVHGVLYHSTFDKEFLNGINNTVVNSINDQGVLIIDIKDKSPQDIDNILRRRLYTSIF